MSTATLHHLGYVVHRMDRGISQFVAEGSTVVIEPTDDPIQKVTCALLRMPDGTHVELVAPLDPEDSPVTSRLRRGGGLDHVCYSVADVQTAIDDEVAAGGVVVCEPVPAVTFGETIAFVRRRSGMLVEYMSGGA